VPRLKTYPKVDFLSSTKPAQFESIYPHNLGSLLLLYRIPNSSVPFTYLITRFIVVQCSTFNAIINLEMKLTAKLRSGLVVVRYINFPTSYLYSDSLNAFETVLAEIFSPFSIGVGDIFQSSILNLSNKILAYFACETKMLLHVFQTYTPR
jgi:hypothetical protein